MSDENFLARWSRRKAEAEKADAPERAHADKPPHQSPPSEPAAPPQRPDASTIPGRAAPEAAPFDPKDLPPIDSIGPGTDVSVFLRPGVPAEIARAALRRAWTADPAIRDYIGLSENAWDFTAPHGVPGFGPLSPEDAERLLAEFTGQMKDAMEKVRAARAGDDESGDQAQHAIHSRESAGSSDHDRGAAAQAEKVDQARDHPEPLSAAAASLLPQRESRPTAVQHLRSDPDARGKPGGPPLRRHGRALPE